MEPTVTAPATTPSAALTVWQRDRQPQLEIVSRLAAEAVTEPEADLLTRAYVLVLAAEFQAFFTDLLSVISGALVAALPDEVPPEFRLLLRDALEDGRVVGFRNPDATTLRRDLRRFDLELRELVVRGPAGASLLTRLDQLIRVRNKLAHGGATVSTLGTDGRRLTASDVDDWRSEIDRLATTLDRAVARHLSHRLSIEPAGKESA